MMASDLAGQRPFLTDGPASLAADGSVRREGVKTDISHCGAARTDRVDATSMSYERKAV